MVEQALAAFIDEMNRLKSSKRAWRTISKEARDILKDVELPEYVPCKDKEWVSYRKKVWDVTNKNSHLVEDNDKRGFDSYHLDHKTSIWDGFNKGIDPEIIGGVDNLRVIPAEDNMRKGRKSV